MNEQLSRRRGKRRARHFVVIALRSLYAVFYIAREKISQDLVVIWRNGRLCMGMLLMVFGFLSFQSDRYCDGNTSSYYACTRPSTYYYYPWWAILFVMGGSLFIVLWFFRRNVRT